MTKTKRRMFLTPSLRLSATASSAAAASTASRIKSNLSTVTKLPTALKRSSANNMNAEDEDSKVYVNHAETRTISSLSSSNTESSVKHEESKATPRMYGIPSLRSVRTGSKDKAYSKVASDSSLESLEAQINSNNNYSSGINNSEEKAERNDEPESQKSAVNSASRFVMGMPTMLRRAVSNHHTPDAPVVIHKKSPDTSANSTPQGELSEDGPENDRHSLLMMLQVPQTRRHSQVPLMAASETW